VNAVRLFGFNREHDTLVFHRNLLGESAGRNPSPEARDSKFLQNVGKFYQTAYNHIIEVTILYSHCCDNLRSSTCDSGIGLYPEILL